jgi:hypothetical protein
MTGASAIARMIRLSVVAHFRIQVNLAEPHEATFVL